MRYLLRNAFLTFSFLVLIPHIFAQDNQSNYLSEKAITISRNDLLSNEVFINNIQFSVPGLSIQNQNSFKFYGGDNFQFSQLNYDDSKWKKVDLSNNDILDNKKIYWGRVKFHLEDDLKSQPIILSIHWEGAMEVYLDGKLIYSFGQFANSSNNQTYKDATYVPRHSVMIPETDNKGAQLLAIRFSQNPKFKHKTGCQLLNGEVPFGLTLHTQKNEELILKAETILNAIYGFFIGVNFIILLITAFQIRKKNKDKTWLMLGLFSLFVTIVAFTNIIIKGKFGLTLNEVSVINFFNEFAYGSSFVLLLFVMRSMFDALNNRTPFIYISIAVFCYLSFYVPYFYSIDLNSITLLITLIVFLEVIRITIRTFRDKVYGRWIIVIGALLFILFGPILEQFCNAIQVTLPFGIKMFERSMYYLAMPISFLIFLAVQSSRNIRLLARQRDELDLEVSERTAELKDSLDELKSTQAQLIQSEKMASLGELTAGIAHEIQNPLNFVNNFSEVNKELLAEMKDEMSKGNIDDAKEIANDVIANEEKINHHGKRADVIVKGMLQHSRSSSGVKEPTDINKLADEYLRLAYHGLRAKDKSFNATLKTDYDETIGNINIIPQDIGRVVLNLITNAFYAVDEKKKSGAENLPTGQAGYEPTVTVSTKKINDKTEIRVTDNGNGIPENVIDKIFQPFFTTKPTGQGTGLGLSLAYDIVKAHGGELKVETKEGEGSKFIITLPFN